MNWNMNMIQIQFISHYQEKNLANNNGWVSVYKLNFLNKKIYIKYIIIKLIQLWRDKFCKN